MASTMNMSRGGGRKKKTCKKGKLSSLSCSSFNSVLPLLNVFVAGLVLFITNSSLYKKRAGIIFFSSILDYDVEDDKIKKLTKELEDESSLKYYVYEDDLIRLPMVREQAMKRVKPWAWQERWGERFQHYARGDIRWIEALENHKTLRTRNASEALFFVVPIPITATFFWGTPENRTVAFNRAFEFLSSKQQKSNSLFHKYGPNMHVSAISTSESLFKKSWGLNGEQLEQLKNTTVIRDSSRTNMVRYLRRQRHLSRQRRQFLPKYWCGQKGLKNTEHLSELALGYGGEGSNPDYRYQPITYEKFMNKTFWFFYHTREEDSECNSTIFRHILLREDGMEDGVVRKKNVSNMFGRYNLQPVSIGYFIPYERWQREFYDSKFCLVIRGDQPGSRSLFRAIRAGCVPMIVSDLLPHFQMLYSRTLGYDDFALMIPEDNFLKDPILSMKDAVATLFDGNENYNEELRKKIDGLRLMQRIIAADQPDSLFVPALAREIVGNINDK